MEWFEATTDLVYANDVNGTEPLGLRLFLLESSNYTGWSKFQKFVLVNKLWEIYGTKPTFNAIQNSTFLWR